MNIAEKLAKFKAEREVVSTVTGFNSRVLLVDGMNTYIRCFSATPTMDDNGTHIGGITGFLLSLGAAIRSYHPSRVIIVFDGAGGSLRRRQLFKEYKTNRKMMTRLNRTYDFSSVEEEKEAQTWQLMKLYVLLQHLPVTVIQIDNVEADDIIAYLSNYTVEKGGKSIIMSTDKDFLQLVGENTSVYNPSKKVLYRPEAVVRDYGFHPHNFLLYRMVTGDSSDNIPGVDGIGEKTLLKYFPELALEEVRDLNFMMESAASQIAAKKKPPVALTKFVESRTLLELNQKLMRLDSEVQLNTHARIAAMNMFDNAKPFLNKLELTKEASSDRILSTFSNWNSWVIETFAALAMKK